MTTKLSAHATASGIGVPAFIMPSSHATESAMVATIERSMPRPIMAIAMPTPRMPRMDTFWTSDHRLAGERKPFSAKEKNTNNAIAMIRTMRSWFTR